MKKKIKEIFGRLNEKVKENFIYLPVAKNIEATCINTVRTVI